MPNPKPLQTCESCGREFWSQDELLKNCSRWRICERKNLWFNCSCNSTIVIPKGKYPWYAPEDRLSADAKSILNCLATIQTLPHIPSYVADLQALAGQESTSSGILAKQVRKSPILASSVLKLANSKSRQQPIDSLEHAISYIGLKSFNSMVQIAAIHTWQTPCLVFSRERFWEASFLTGEIAEFLAERCNLDIQGDEAYLAGAMVNLGKIVLAMVDPKLTDKVARQVDNLKNLSTWQEAEANLSAPDHIALGEIIASFWGFPEFVISAICNHHKGSTTGHGEAINSDELAGFANQICHWVSLMPHRIDSKLLSSYSDRFNLSSLQLEELTSELMHLKRKSA